MDIMKLRPNNSFRPKIKIKPLNWLPIPMAPTRSVGQPPTKKTHKNVRKIIPKRTPILTRISKRGTRKHRLSKNTTPKQMARGPAPATPLSILDQKILAIKTYEELGWKTTLCRDKVSRSVFKSVDEVPDVNELIKILRTNPTLNVAICPGIPSNWLIDVDVDNKESLELAPLMLPKTGLISGRTSRPRSHYWYISKGCRPIYCRDDKNCWSEDRKHGIVAEIRDGSGLGYSIQAPPSCNYHHGEKYSWDAWGTPTTIDHKLLSSAVRKLVVAACLRAHGWKVNDSIKFVENCTFRQLQFIEKQIGGPPLTKWYGYEGS